MCPLTLKTKLRVATAFTQMRHMFIYYDIDIVTLLLGKAK